MFDTDFFVDSLDDSRDNLDDLIENLTVLSEEDYPDSGPFIIEALENAIAELEEARRLMLDV